MSLLSVEIKEPEWKARTGGFYCCLLPQCGMRSLSCCLFMPLKYGCYF